MSSENRDPIQAAGGSGSLGGYFNVLSQGVFSWWNALTAPPPAPPRCLASHPMPHADDSRLLIGCTLAEGHAGHHRAIYTVVWPNDQEVPQPNYTPSPAPPGSIEWDR